MTSPDPDHGRSVRDLFRRIAGWYDFLNHFLSFGMDIYWRYRLVRLAAVGQRGRVLDLAAGTLDVSLKIASQYPQAEIVAADFCFPMLARGRTKTRKKGVTTIEVVCADGLSLPFQPDTFDCVTIAFGIRNIRPREGAYEQIRRVLKPGGRFYILEFGSGKKKIWRGVYNFYLKYLLPAAGRLFSRDKAAYSYLADTIASFPDARELERELVRAGFARVFSIPLTSGIVRIHVAEKEASAPVH